MQSCVSRAEKAAVDAGMPRGGIPGNALSHEVAIAPCRRREPPVCTHPKSSRFSSGGDAATGESRRRGRAGIRRLAPPAGICRSFGTNSGTPRPRFRPCGIAQLVIAGNKFLEYKLQPVGLRTRRRLLRPAGRDAQLTRLPLLDASDHRRHRRLRLFERLDQSVGLLSRHGDQQPAGRLRITQ